MDGLTKKKRLRGWPNSDIASVKKRLAKILAQVEQEKIDVPRARLLIQGANVLVTSLKVEHELEIEKRLDEIERRIEGKGGRA